ncbi:MAG: oligopeptide transporter permease [Dehalococcoidia bacterium]|nr:oligopeptide transporter permease [Dehalococcoidia bacterium]
MSQGLAGYIIRRLFWAVPVILSVSILVFLLVRLAPIDPIDSLLGLRYDEEMAERLKAKYGYDRPLHIQYLKYVQNLFQGDLGVSTRHSDFSVAEVVIPKVRVSAGMGVMAIALAFGLGIPVGVYAALMRGTPIDPLTIGSWLLIDSIPVFVSAIWVPWFLALKLGWIHLAYEGVLHPNILVPVLLMSLPGVAGVARLMRASVIQVISEDYVRTARAKGLREHTVVITHVVRNALLPMITVIGLSLPGIFTGSLFIELIFGIPGIAAEALAAVRAPDYDVMLGLSLFIFVLFILANIAIDIAYGFIDPRVRVGAAKGG